MNRELFLDKGERVLVLTVSMVLAAETLFTIMSTGQQFAWPRLLLGIFGAVFILFLAQRLYAGDHSVEKIALIWAVFQIVLLVASLLVGPEPRTGVLGMLQDIGMPWRSYATLKLIAYLAFAGALLAPGSARAFLAGKRGDDVAKFIPVAVAETSTPVSWTADQKKVLADVASWMQIAAAVLILLGVYLILNAIPPSLQMSSRQMLALLDGVLILGLGALLFAPAQAIGGTGAHESCTSGCLQGALTRLTYWHYAVIVVGVGLIDTVVLRFLMAWEII